MQHRRIKDYIKISKCHLEGMSPYSSGLLNVFCLIAYKSKSLLWKRSVATRIDFHSTIDLWGLGLINIINDFSIKVSHLWGSNSQHLGFIERFTLTPKLNRVITNVMSSICNNLCSGKVVSPWSWCSCGGCWQSASVWPATDTSDESADLWALWLSLPQPMFHPVSL